MVSLKSMTKAELEHKIKVLEYEIQQERSRVYKLQCLYDEFRDSIENADTIRLQDRIEELEQQLADTEKEAEEDYNGLLKEFDETKDKIKWYILDQDLYNSNYELYCFLDNLI